MQTRDYLTSRISSVFISLCVILLSNCNVVIAATSLADTPILAASANVPGNVALVLSVEFPTGDTTPYADTGYSQLLEYVGYFDPDKCYSYFTSTANGRYFTPIDLAAKNHDCSAITNGRWSGNFLNWSLTQVIDPMRSTLTGGHRVVDIDGLTILEKAYADAQGAYTAPNHVLSDSTVIFKSTPYAATVSTLTVRIGGLGTRFLITSSGNINASNTGTTTLPTPPTNPVANTVYDLMARVEVCKTSLLEENCTLYPNGNYKPTGLIQKNALKLNFAAFGYLNDSDPKRDGGVLRAKMSALGPFKTQGSSIVPNPLAEWDGNSGVFLTNPNQSDADIGGASNSGVINYLNKFGKITPGYKSNDPVSELYYTAGRYFRNKGNVKEYTDNASSAMQDGFPVITNWNDPITSSCQANFIIGVGDSRTHADSNLPGSNISNGSYEPSRPKDVSKDYVANGLTSTTTNYTDVEQSTNRVGQMQGLGNLGTVTPLSWCCGDNSTFFIAGLAYDLHTRDFRPDVAGKQTITTFWLDTLELGLDNSTTSGMRNQYWLATKYGGFTVPSGYSPYGALTTLDKSQWDTDVNGSDNDDPDNYFRANKPALMMSGLDKAFSAIANSVNGFSNVFATTSPSVKNGTLVYASSYSSAGWTGDVTASETPVDNNGIIGKAAVTLWNAAKKLESQNWNTDRIIATTNPSKANCNLAAAPAAGTNNNCGVPFRMPTNGGDGISATQAGFLGNATSQQNVLNFLRGDTTNEGTTFRNRVQVLGDIVNSKVVPVGPPSKAYIDSFNPGYSDYKTTSLAASRPTVVYVGANDGMLHAFDGRKPADSVTAGKELFAYVPNALFQGPNGTPSTDGLAQLASTSYVHHYYVDATPAVADVDFSNDGTQWRTILVGGLGKGGRSYFALDVTDPASIKDEATLKGKVLWELSHPNMGFTYDTPLVIKVDRTSWVYTTQSGTKSDWVVVLTSGYNNTSNNNQGSLFFVKASNGSLIAEVKTGTVYSSDAGLAHVNAFVADARSGVADAVYAGDLWGNVWRVDLTAGSTPTPVNIAAFGSTQPITTSPLIEVDVSTGKRFVFVGTGKLLDSGDMNNTQAQTFYAIRDGWISSFYISATGKPNSLPSGISFPISRSNMVDNTGTIIKGITGDSSKPMGYYIDLPSNGSKPYFINVELASASGIVGFVANSVNNSDACNPIGSNITYQLQYGTGQSAQTDLSGNLVSYIESKGTGLATDVHFVIRTFTDSTGTHNDVGLIVCDEKGNCSWRATKTSSTKPFTQLNWRELPTAD